MTREYYTVEQISALLDMHPKTIQRYIREGKLRATKIGKGWRVTGHDLSGFVESHRDESTDAENRPELTTTASSVVDIAACGKERAIRIMNALTAAMNSKPPEYGRSSIQSQYIECDSTVRITLWGGIQFISVMLEAIASLAEQNAEGAE